MKRIRIKNYKVFVPLVMMVLMIILFSSQSDYFLSFSNFINILREAAIPGIIGVGVVIVIAGGDIDLSTGAIVGFLGMTCANFIMRFRIITAISVILTIAVGILCGLLNALLVEKLKLNSFIVTIATQNIFKGLQILISFRDEKGNVFTESITNRVFLKLGKGIGPIYYSIIIFLVLVIVGYIMLKMTKLGINIYAVGSDRQAATVSGVNSDAIRRITFMIDGACCAVAAILMTARNGAATAAAGTGLEFDALCAVIIGGAAMFTTGGDTSTIAPLVGSIFVEILMNGIYKLNMPAAYQTVFKGSALIFMIIIDALFIFIRSRRKAAAVAKQLKAGV